MQLMKRLDILCTSKIDTKQFLLFIQYGQTIQKLTIREQLEDSIFYEAFCLALDEGTVLKLRPPTLKIVTYLHLNSGFLLGTAVALLRL